MPRSRKILAFLAVLVATLAAGEIAASWSWSHGLSDLAAGSWVPPGPGGPIWRTVRFLGQHLAWPAFLLSRLGVSHSWLLLAVGTALLARPAVRAATSRFWLLAGLVPVYMALGWAYFWLLPVPQPLAPLGVWRTEVVDEAIYMDGYDRGYREGLSDSYVNEEPLPRAYARGKGDGMLAGAAERLRVEPWFMSSFIAEFLRQHPPW